MFRLEPSIYPNEQPGIKWQGELLSASQFGDSDFMAACESIGKFSRQSLLKIWTAYTDDKILMTGNRRSGEPNYFHPVGVALVGILEFGNVHVDSVVADLMHDVKEDSPFFQGHNNLKGEFETFSPFDMLAGRYGEVVAKIVMCDSKPERPQPKAEMSSDTNELYLHWVYNRVVNLYPEVRVMAAQTKTRDRIFNLRTEVDEKRLARNLVETVRYIVPISKLAGEMYEDKLWEEVRERDNVLTASQKAMAIPQTFTLE